MSTIQIQGLQLRDFSLANNYNLYSLNLHCSCYFNYNLYNPHEEFSRCIFEQYNFKRQSFRCISDSNLFQDKHRTVPDKSARKDRCFESAANTTIMRVYESTIFSINLN